jgi:hypothetical protein
VSLLDRSDRAVSHAAEDVGRRLARREFLSKGMKQTAGLIAALTVGNLARPGLAVAGAVNDCGDSSFQCMYPGGVHCTGTYGQCPSKGCPSGCTKCHFGDCGVCPYADGSWVCCRNCCQGGTGYILCFDCKCPGCANKCGCTSDCQT